MSLDELKQALAPRLAAHPEVKVGSLHATLAEFLTLTVEPEHGPHRYLRVAVAPPESGTAYTIRWSSYRGASEAENSDGGTCGDLAFTLRAIDHWIFEGRPWDEVPELTVPPGEPV